MTLTFATEEFSPDERATLERRGINVHFRHRKGNAIDAACGQLRRRARSEESRVEAIKS